MVATPGDWEPEYRMSLSQYVIHLQVSRFAVQHDRDASEHDARSVHELHAIRHSNTEGETCVIFCTGISIRFALLMVHTRPAVTHTFPLGLTSHNRLILGYSCLRRRRRLLDMAEVNRRRLLDMAVFLTWSLSSAIRRRRQPACNMSVQIRLILALPWRNNRRIDEILTQLEIASLPLEATFWRQPVVRCK